LTSKDIVEITQTSAKSGGFITSDGGSSIIECGICWSTDTLPTINDNKTIDSLGNGGFTSSITNLKSKTIYYIRAYATNKIGTGYGLTKKITTLGTVPVLKTSNSSITGNTVICGGNITNNGGESVVVRGVCWSTDTLPTINDNKTIDSLGNGLFVSSIKNLTPNTTYYIKAYASNSIGTGYGNTIIIVSDVEGNLYNSISIGNQIWMKENLKTTLYNDGSSIPNIKDSLMWYNSTTPAYCWYRNELKNKEIYGGLYNWYSVNTGKLCPIGWHVPTETEWNSFMNFLGGREFIGGKLMEIGTSHWINNNISDNSSGFTALPGGYIYNKFYGLGEQGNWWSSTSGNGINNGWAFTIWDNYIVTSFGVGPANDGFSVRCIKD